MVCYNYDTMKNNTMNGRDFLKEADMNQLTIFSWFGFPIPMKERFKLIKSAGFAGVLLWWSDEYFLL